MVVGKSPEWLPPGFIEKTKYRNGKKIRYYLKVETGAKYHSKKDVMLATVDSGEIVTPQEENGDDNVLSSDNKADDILSKTNDSSAWLPNGWKIEEKIRQGGSSKGSAYKVYTDSSGERKFYSKAAVIRYLNTPNQANTSTVQKVDNLDEPNVIESNANESTVDDPKIVDVPSTDMSPQPVSVTKTGGTEKKKLKHKSFTTVSVERTTDDDLPPGWIKEIRTSISGDKIRRDPYYKDPVGSYEFRSKLDALRYIETNDIKKCRIKPLKRVADGAELIDNTIPSTDPANEKSSVHKRQHLLGGESNGDKESSGTKIVAESEEQMPGNLEPDSVKDTSVSEEKIPSENAEKNVEPLAFALPETGPSTKQQPSESGKRARAPSSKSKKRKDSSVSLRTSKRLAGSQPEIGSNSDLNERSFRAAARESSATEAVESFKDPASIPMPSEIAPTKESEQALVGEEAHQDPVMEVENPPTEDPLNESEQALIGEEAHQDPVMEVENPPTEDPLNEAEKPPTEVPIIQEEQLVGDTSEKQINEGKQLEESQLCFDFGDSWSYPMEFALKTLMGDISIDEFNEQISVPSTKDECLKQPQSDAPAPSEFASHPGSSKPPSANLSTDALFEGIFGGYDNFQDDTEVGKTDSQTKRNP